MKRVRFGPYGLQVAIWRDGDRIRAEWREQGRRRKRSWPNTAEHWRVAKAWARGFAAQRALTGVVVPAVTLRELWTRFIEAQDHLRPRTVVLYHGRWRKLELFAGKDAIADTVGPQTLDALRHVLKRQGMAPNQIRMVIATARIVYNWGEDRELLTRNRVGRYRIPRAKDAPRFRPAEYRLEEFRALQAELDPTNTRQWRAWAVLTLLGNQGVRVNAALHLRWTDVADDVLIWRAAWDKMGKEWTQPLRGETRIALEVARTWRARTGYTGPWVFFSNRSTDPYKVQGFWWQLRRAEQRAGIPHQPYRAAHGFRRMLVTEAAELTGNVVQALQFVGDDDVKQANTYVQRRDDRLIGVANLLDGTEKAPEKTPEPVSASTVRATGRTRTVDHSITNRELYH